MTYTSIMSILVCLGGWVFLYLHDQHSAIICFCSSIILCAMRELQKQTHAKLEAIEKKITK